MTTDHGELMGYRQIADRLGVQVQAVRIYRVNGPDFPSPVTASDARPVQFDLTEVERYVVIRQNRNR